MITVCVSVIASRRPTAAKEVASPRASAEPLGLFALVHAAVARVAEGMCFLAVQQRAGLGDIAVELGAAMIVASTIVPARISSSLLARVGVDLLEQRTREVVVLRQTANFNSVVASGTDSRDRSTPTKSMRSISAGNFSRRLRFFFIAYSALAKLRWLIAALLLGILTVLAFAWKPVIVRFAEGSKAAIAGALLASMNTASEYGFGGVIAALPGFLVVADVLKSIPYPLVNEAITVTTLAGITGSAS